MNKEDVKVILGLYNTKFDAYIDLAIPLFIEFAQEHCNNNFSDENGTLTLKGGVKLFIAKAIEFNMNKAGQSSRSFSDVSYSFSTDFPQSVMQLLEPYQRIRV